MCGNVLLKVRSTPLKYHNMTSIEYSCTVRVLVQYWYTSTGYTSTSIQVVQYWYTSTGIPIPVNQYWFSICNFHSAWTSEHWLSRQPGWDWLSDGQTAAAGTLNIDSAAKLPSWKTAKLKQGPAECSALARSGRPCTSVQLYSTSSVRFVQYRSIDLHVHVHVS